MVSTALTSYWRRVASMGALFLFFSGTSSLAETQSFESAAAAAAVGWAEFGSRANNQDFGFSASNNAQGVSGAGEGGGTVARSEPSGYFGDVTIGSSDLSVDVHATGRLIFQDSAFDGEFFFGYFDRLQAEANNRDYLGIRVREPRPEGWRINASIDGSDGNQVFVPNDTPLDFSIDWDADGGAAVGDGKLTVTLSTLDGSQTIVSEHEGTDGMTINAFGLLSNSQSGNPTQITSFSFDDLSYSTVPEPNGVLLAIVALAGPIAFRWTRRKSSM